jgi:signal transduction histidine kinase/CheY-like chemotaxis protein/CHASE3 domain sensor protein
MKNAATRLYLGFAVALIISITVGIVTYQTFQNQAEENLRVKHSYEVMYTTSEVQKLLVDMETGRRAYRLATEAKFLEPYYAGGRRINGAMIQLKQLVSDNPVQTANVAEVDKSIDAILQYWESLPVAKVADYTREDMATITGREKELMDVVRAAMKKTFETESNLLHTRQQDTARALSFANKVAVTGSALTQVIILMLIFFIIKEFNTRRRAQDELKENLNEVNALNEESSNKNWLLTGVANVNDSLQGVNDVPVLAKNVLDVVLGYLNVEAGAFYVYNEETKALTLEAHKALPHSVQHEYHMDEGLIGSAAAKDEIQVVKNIPPSYWQVGSASGNALPGEIMYLPLYYNKEIKGIVEVAAFRAFTPLQVAFAGIIVNNIATAINSAHARAKVMILLEQVQEQKINLQNQQEELRQTNEELTRQSEVLQASEEELRVQEEELRQINAELEEKNEAVELSRQALMLKARELEITGKYKSEFLANMSHELRTPLNSVLILAKLLSENKAKTLSDKQIEYANIIHKSGTDLLNIINDILDLSKIEAGKIDFTFEDVSVKGIIHDITQTFYVISEEKGIAFKQEKAPGVPDKIQTDKQRLEQVIKNLLSNAFKFTPRNGTVTLSFDTVTDATLNEDHLRNADSVLKISVTDTGIGIAEDKQQVVFEAFQQADGSTSRKYGGTGLGLSISKELVKKLGGEMRLVSEEGQGSTFSIYLPLSLEGLNERATNQVSEEVKNVPEVTLANVAEQTAINDDREQLKKGDKVMLIIEDDPHFASIVQDFARGKGYKTIVALQGDEGLYYARKYRPSAIILDIQLPVLDGWTVLKLLKDDKNLKNIPVHIMSATDDNSRSNGAALAFLKKPLEKEDLEDAFTLLGKHIHSDIRNVLVLSGENLSDNLLKKLIEERHFDIHCDFVKQIGEVADKLKTGGYDSFIVDIGKDLVKGKDDLEKIHEMVKDEKIPVIIYLDKDISTHQELEFKKLSDVVIRESAQSNARLMDELELFLYKVQEVEKSPSVLATSQITTDETLLKGKKVLLADDDMRNVFALSTLLEGQEMVVVTAEDGKDALLKLNENPDIDIVLMDIMMPEMDGYEATKQIRADKRFKTLPIIALTAKAMQGDKEKTIEAGASDYITKPIDSSRLFSLMRVWLSA